MGNIGSVVNMLNRLNIQNKIIKTSKEIESVNKLILPGVGHFGNAMINLRKNDLEIGIKENAKRENFHLMGICLGMQLLANFSEEGDAMGLGIIDGIVQKFDNLKDNLKVPHMGWNTVEFKEDPIISSELYSFSKFYFVHSYYFNTAKKDNILGETEYGIQFTSAVKSDNIYGFQFHPEKSHIYGMQIFKQFSAL